ncbi:MAG: caspase family protein [Nitrospinae bacterium]|nr:caspase family protein [Nitrospinota bacterium]
MKKFSLTFLIFLTFLLFFLPTVQSEERSVTVKPKRDLSVEAKKGLDPALLNAKYHAIIIGNNNYKYITKLKTAIADAKSVDEILKNQYGFQTKLLIDATRGDILDTLNDFRKIGKNDNLLIYYAGHGVFEKEVGKAYWLPVDAKSDSPSNWIIADDITSSIKRITSRHILIVSDSCYSGTLTRAVSGDLSKAGEREEFIKKVWSVLQEPSWQVEGMSL